MGTLRFISELTLFVTALGFAALVLSRQGFAARVASTGAASIAIAAFSRGAQIGEQRAGAFLLGGAIVIALHLPIGDRTTRPQLAMACIVLSAPLAGGSSVAVAHLAASACFAFAAAHVTRRSTAASVAASTASPLGAGSLVAASIIAFATVTTILLTPTTPSSPVASPPPPELRAPTVVHATPADPPLPVARPVAARRRAHPPARPPSVIEPPKAQTCTIRRDDCLADVSIKTAPLPSVGVETHLPVVGNVSQEVSAAAVVDVVLGLIGAIL